MARLCAYVPDEELCTDPEQAAAFNLLISTYRELAAAPIFKTPEDFLDFVEGRGAAYDEVRAMLGDDNPLIDWTPVVIPDGSRADIASELTS